MYRHLLSMKCDQSLQVMRNSGSTGWMVTSGAFCRLDSWCSSQKCAFESYVDWLWLSLV